MRLSQLDANKSSNTETFVSIRVDIDDWRWAGVPFYLRTGKRLPTKCSEVVVYFKNPALNLFRESYQQLPQNVSFRCTCSRERCADALITLSEDDVKEMLEQDGNIDMNCEYCGTHYLFDAVDIATLKSGNSPSSEQIH